MLKDTGHLKLAARSKMKVKTVLRIAWLFAIQLKSNNSGLLAARLFPDLNHFNLAAQQENLITHRPPSLELASNERWIRDDSSL